MSSKTIREVTRAHEIYAYDADFQQSIVEGQSWLSKDLEILKRNFLVRTM
jgi:hypothetical protein